jgi:EmrB/QacA subfamily drug resistance transporter
MSQSIATRAGSRNWVMGLAAFASFMVMLDAMVVTLALNTIRHDLGASLEALEWTVNAYNLPFAVLLLPSAALGDRFGRRRMLILGFTLFTVASVACALAPNIGWLIAARAVQGVGASFVTPLAVALLSVAFPRDERAKALGIFTAISGIALIAGPVVGGAISQGLSWQWIFWINIPLGLVIVPLIYRRIDESFGQIAALDLPGLILVAGAAFAVVWGLMHAASAGWASVEVVGWLAAGAVLAIAFVAVELRVREPMVPMRLFRSRAFSAGVASGFIFNAAMYGVLFLLPQFLQTGQGYGALDAGLRMLPWTAMLFIFAPIGGAMVNRVGERALVVGGVTAQGLGFAWLATIAAPDLAFLSLVPPLMLAGAGVTMAMPAAQNAVLGSVAPAEVGKAAGAYNMFRFLGGVTGIAIAATVFASHGSFGSASEFSAGFAAAMAVSAALSLVAGLVGMCLYGWRRVVLTAGDMKA